MRDLTIILPTFNEGANMSKLINRLHKLYPRAKIMVADDGSTDMTQEIVRASRHALLFDHSSYTRGLTASVIDAIKKVETERIVVMDADFQHPPKVVGKISKLLSKNSLVVATRVSTRGWSIHRKLISATATILSRLMLLIHQAPTISDPMSGFFGIRAGLAQRVIQLHRKRFVEEGYKVLFDITKCLPHDIRYASVNYDFGMRAGGESKLKVKHFGYLMKSFFS